MQPHGWQPTRLPHPWDSPGKNTGVCCHFLLQCMKVKSESEVAQSCLTLQDPMDCSLPGSSIHGISQARVLEWVAIAFSVCLPRGFNFETRNVSIGDTIKIPLNWEWLPFATLGSSSLWSNRKKKGVTMLAAVINPGDQGKYAPIAQWG